MRSLSSFLAAALLLTASLPLFATVFANVHGVVHDSQHRPIAGATVTLQAAASDFVLQATTNADGEFDLQPLPGQPQMFPLRAREAHALASVEQGRPAGRIHGKRP